MNDNQNKEAARAGFEAAWQSEIEANGGVAVGADYRHWMEKGYLAALSSQPSAAPAGGVPREWIDMMDRVTRYFETLPHTKIATDTIANEARKLLSLMMSASPAAPDVQGEKPAAQGVVSDRAENRLFDEWLEKQTRGVDLGLVTQNQMWAAWKARAALASQAPQTAAAEAGWVSVDERLPEEQVPVIIASYKFNEPSEGRFVTIACRSPSGVYYDEDTGDHFYQPTHWMPLPSAPATHPTKDA
jgi:hypothetical protein